MTPRLLAVAAGLTALVLAAPATGPAHAAPADPPVPPGGTTFAHSRLEAMATDDAGELVVVTADQDGTGDTHHLYATTRDPAGAWGSPVELAADPQGLLGQAHLALAGDGTGVVVWDQDTGPSLRANRVWTRVRHADGSWGAPTKVAVRHDVWPEENALAVPGHVAVTFRADHYLLTAATSDSEGTSWRTIAPPPGEAGTDSRSMVLDADGGLHDLTQLFPHGGGGDIWISRLPAGASTWSRPQHIATPYLSTATAQLAIDAKGRELLLFGYLGHRGYRPLGDTDLTGSTAFRLLRQAGPGPFRTVWRAPAAGDALLSQAGGKVRVTWERWKGHVGRHPRVVQLRTQLLSQDSSVVLDRADHGHFWFDAAGGQQFAVSWIKPKVKELYAAGTNRIPVLLDSRADEAIWGYWATAGQPAVAGAQPFVAWEHRFVEGDDQALVDSDTSVAPLP